MDIRRTMGSESKHISLRAISGSNAVAKSIAGATNTNARGNSSTSAQNALRRWNKHEGLRKLSERAKANGTLIKILYCGMSISIIVTFLNLLFHEFKKIL